MGKFVVSKDKMAHGGDLPHAKWREAVVRQKGQGIGGLIQKNPSAIKEWAKIAEGTETLPWSLFWI